MPPRRDTRMPTNQAELQGIIAAAIAQYAASQGDSSGNISNNNNNPSNGCTFKQFLDCKPQNIDGTGGAVAFTRWTEKTETTIRMSKLPYMVTPEFKHVERFIWGLAPQIMSMVTTSKPATITEAIALSISLTEEAIRLNQFSKDDQKKKETHVESSGENKPKFSNFKQGTSSGSKRSKSNTPARAKTGGENRGKGYMGTLPKCGICQFHHPGPCRLRKCESCGKKGHSKETCWAGSGQGRQRGYNNNNRGNGNRPQGNNGGNGNRGNALNQAGNRGTNGNRNGNGFA
ncbi:N66 matrix protein-like [Helianthus annuus]|uniref:N66 matrix protein-like n=1 Tax=Helianthus annuus TaxID=4232 RepID=UPI0016531A6A|nr:N66 matrix protein-like [Helianthus annuus]